MVWSVQQLAQQTTSGHRLELQGGSGLRGKWPIEKMLRKVGAVDLFSALTEYVMLLQPAVGRSAIGYRGQRGMHL